MTDYYPLIARAVAGLDKNTGESRRALYERARTALVAQLRGLEPPLSESEITRERVALEEAIRKVEAESARRSRIDTPRPDVAPPPSPPPPSDPPRREAAATVLKAVPMAQPARRETPVEAPAIEARRHATLNPEPILGRSAPRARRAPERPPISDGGGLKGFRDVVAEAETLGGATAQAARSAREVYASVPAGVPELDRIEPRVEPEGLRAPAQETPPDRVNEPMLRPRENLPRSLSSPPLPRPMSRPDDDDDLLPEAKSNIGSIAAIVAVVFILACAIMAYIEREQIGALLGSVRSPSPTQQDAASNRPKISDRVGQPDQARQQPATQTAPEAAVAQRVVLYEEDPADPQGKRYLGTAIWRTEMISPGSGQAPELAVRADLEIAERKINMTMTLRRNTDQALPASHTVEIMFNLPSDFPFGGISNVPGILMKPAEQTRGAPLAGLAVKVTSGFFLVGLSSVEADMQRNVQLLKERSWFDIPIVYNNNRRAILAVEKGIPGERAFNEAFAAWGQ